MADNKQPRQNPSGHIFMDVQLSNFHREVNHKIHKITKLQEAGLLNQKPARNPLAAEKSPRNQFNGWDFNPPPKHDPDNEGGAGSNNSKNNNSNPRKWHYPESDWGLMAKFSSQKEIYNNIYEREKSQKSIELEISRLREKNLQLIEKEIKKRQENLERVKQERENNDREFQRMQDMIDNPDRYSHMQQQQQQQAETIGLGRLPSFDDDSLMEEMRSGVHSRHSKLNDEKRIAAINLDMNTSSLFNKFGKSSRNQEMLERFMKQQGKSGSTQPAPTTGGDTLTTTTTTKNQKQQQELLKKTKKQFKKSLDLYEKNLVNTYHQSSLKDIPITNFKELQDNHPQLLAQYRTERAAEFIAQRGTASLQPPKQRNDIGTIAFRPGGILPAGNRNRQSDKKNGSSDLTFSEPSSSSSAAAAAAMIPIDLLNAQLKKTEEDIAYQTVKIGLHKRPPKHYERSTNRF